MIHYKIANRLSISTGAGYRRSDWSMKSWLILSSFDLTKSQRFIENRIELPIQLGYRIIKPNEYFDTYINVQFTNALSLNKSISYQYEEIVDELTYSYYTSMIAIGIGSHFRQGKSVGLLFEGSVGSYFDEGFLRMYLLRLKIGIVFK